MRDFSMVSPTFWTTGPGRLLRGEPVSQIVALYLMTCPAANMVGIFYLPLPTIAHETAMTSQQVRDALASCARIGHAMYDEEAELVWMPEHASRQIGSALHEKDKAKKKGVENALRPYANHRFYVEFLKTYGEAYGLQLPPPVGPHQAPTRPPPVGLLGALEPPRARAHVPAPVLAPDPVSEQDAPRVVVIADPVPQPEAGGPIPDPYVRDQKTYWVEAYRRAVDAARGPKAPPYVFPGVKFNALRDVVETHCRGEDRKAIDRWVERTVTDFARAVLRREPDPRFGDPMTPDKLRDWFNLGRPGYRAPRPAAPPGAGPPTAKAEPPPMSPAESQAEAERLQGMLRGFGA